MNAQDQKEFDAMLKSNQKFDGLFCEFIARVKFPIQRWGAVGIDPLTPKDLKDGKPSRIMAVTTKRDEDKQARLLELTALMRQAERYERELSRFFPEKRRWHWQEVFYNEALGGTGAVTQRQGGGRTVDPDSELRKSYLIWKQSGYNPKVKRQLQDQSGYDADTFSRTMRRLKSQDRTKTL